MMSILGLHSTLAIFADPEFHLRLFVRSESVSITVKTELSLSVRLDFVFAYLLLFVHGEFDESFVLGGSSLFLDLKSLPLSFSRSLVIASLIAFRLGFVKLLLVHVLVSKLVPCGALVKLMPLIVVILIIFIS